MGELPERALQGLEVEAAELLAAYKANVLSTVHERDEQAPPLEGLEAADRILSSPPALRAAVARLAFREARELDVAADLWGPRENLLHYDALPLLAFRLLEDAAAFTLEDYRNFVGQVLTSGNPELNGRQHLVFDAICRRIEEQGADIVLLAELERHRGYWWARQAEGHPTLSETIRLIRRHVKEGHIIQDYPRTAGEFAVDAAEGAGEAACAEAVARLRAPYDRYVKEFEELLTDDPWRTFRLDEMQSGTFMLGLNAEGQRALLYLALDDYGQIAALRLADDADNWRVWSVRSRIREKLISHILDGGIELSSADILDLLPRVVRLFRPETRPLRNFIAVIERFLSSNPPTRKLIDTLKVLRLKHAGHGADEHRTMTARLTKMLAPWFTPGLIEETDWGRSVLRWLDSLAEAERQAWLDLLDHMKTSEGKAKPSAKWLNDAMAHVAAVKGGSFTERVNLWLEAFIPDPEYPDPNADVLKGMIWTASEAGSDELAPAIGRFCEICYKKVPGWGARSMRLGNACLYALGQIGERGVAELVRVRGRMKYIQARKQLEKALASAAERAGLSVADIEEIALPDFGLGADGALTETLGEVAAEIRIGGSDTVKLSWTGADGKPRKSVPASVKENCKEELKELRAKVKEIKGLLAGQRYRLESLYLRDRTWPLDQWRERYLEHPLLATLCRRLIWNFDRVAAVPVGEGFTGANGATFEPAAGVTVSLWHPNDVAPDEVLAWRRRLAALEITQPFKQAHREIYVLTDAERETQTYSNRFAAHVLRQHQFSALCQARGWRYSLQGDWDSHNVPERRLDERNLAIQFAVDPVATNDLTEAYIYQFVTTDRVAFHNRAGGTVDLTDVPPLLFSELMRDVDLFVGVCSIGNDPEWQDRGPGDAFLDYWHGFGFGELSETAKTRRAVLEELLPRLKIADVCELEERFLQVRGKKRSYRIHLGSANIQMEPNSEYLCIVPGRPGAGVDKIQLPFEGDTVLAIILSKAFLLAADDKITDPTILSQIER